MTTKKAVIDNIQRLMEIRNVPSQNSLAQKAKVDQKTINNFFSKSGSIKLDTLDKIAKALHVCPWHLLVPNLPIKYVEDGKKCTKVSPSGFSLLMHYESSSKPVREEISSYAGYVFDRSGDPQKRDKLREAVKSEEPNPSIRH